MLSFSVCSASRSSCYPFYTITTSSALLRRHHIQPRKHIVPSTYAQHPKSGPKPTCLPLLPSSLSSQLYQPKIASAAGITRLSTSPSSPHATSGPLSQVSSSIRFRRYPSGIDKAAEETDRDEREHVVQVGPSKEHPRMAGLMHRWISRPAHMVLFVH